MAPHLHLLRLWLVLAFQIFTSVAELQAWDFYQEGLRQQYTTGDMVRALELYERAAIAPGVEHIDLPGMLNDMGVLYFQRKDSIRAMNAYREAVRLQPSFFVAICNLAGLVHGSGDIVEAKKLYLRY